MYPFIWYQFLATFSTLHPSFHHRSTLAAALLHPRITLASPSPNLSNHYPPFHHPSTHTFSPTSLPFRVFLLCRWREGKARSCGEAARQGVENPKRWDRHWHLQERNEKHTLYIACETKCLGPPFAL